MNGMAWWRQLAVLVALLLLYNIGLAAYAKKWQPYPLVAAAKTAPPATHVLHGNSTMVSAYDHTTFLAALPGSSPLLLAKGNTKTPEHALVYQALPQHHRAALYYGFVDLQLTEDTAAAWSVITNNRTLGLIVAAPQAAEFYAEDSSLEQARFLLTANVPLLLNRGALWGRVEGWRRRAANWGMPPVATNRFGRVTDFAPDSAYTQILRTQLAQHVTDQRPLNSAVREMIGIAKQQQAPVVFIEMPVPTLHRTSFHDNLEWQNYHAYVERLLTQAGVTLIQARDWIDDADFEDTIHVNERGAKIFTQRLLQETPAAK